MKRFGIKAHLDRPEIKATARQIIKWAEKNDVECRFGSELGSLIGREDASHDNEDLCRFSDVIISLGGDGSILTSARTVADRGTPILGINLGGLGFLTEVTEDKLEEALQRLKEDRFEIEQRMVLEVALPGSSQSVLFALNDVVADRGSANKLTRVDLFSNGQFVCSYEGDGLIVATPTGSTAYSLSAGGPVVNPLMEAISVTPISPHTLTLRSIIFPSSDKLTVRASRLDMKLRIAVDGRVAGQLEPGRELSVKKASHKLKLIKLHRSSFYEVLRTKLHWGAMPLLNS